MQCPRLSLTSNPNFEIKFKFVQGHGVDGLHMDGAAFERILDLSPYVNTSAPAVPECFSLDRAYMMFRQLGLRHLVVVDQHNHVKGIVTRKVRLTIC